MAWVEAVRLISIEHLGMLLGCPAEKNRTKSQMSCRSDGSKADKMVPTGSTNCGQMGIEQVV